MTTVKVMAQYGSNSMQASAAIGRFLADEFSAPLVNGSSPEDGEPVDVLLLVNGPVAYYRDTSLQVVERLIEECGEVVWVENDYTMNRHVAKWGTAGNSFVIRAWRRRYENKRRRYHFWTTVRKRKAETPGSAYVNWNSLAYAPLENYQPPEHAADLLYYGAAREGRLKRLDYFFNSPVCRATMYGTSKKLEERYPGVATTRRLTREEFLPELSRHGLGLYVEDEKSSDEFHSPANRFYEMLSAGLPMVFHSASRTMLEQAGFDVGAYVVGNDERLLRAMERRDEIGGQQREVWTRDYRAELRVQVREAWEKLGRIGS